MSTRTDAYDIIRRDALTGIEKRRLQPAAQIGEVLRLLRETRAAA